MEGAFSRAELQEALGRFNQFLHIFSELQSDEVEARDILSAVASLPSSDSFKEFLVSQGNLEDAVHEYKTFVVQNLASTIRQRVDLLRSFQVQDCELLDSLLPEEDTVVAPKVKRDISSVAHKGPSRIPKKRRTTIPALASVGIVAEACDTGLSAKKTLMTRERLRAGLHDPKGLLNLVGPSTDALERTKRLELLKSAGGRLDQSRRNVSFSEGFNAAK